MDAELVRRWNEKVDKGDLVYILGDLIWKCDNVPKLIKSLNGSKILIRGNHDKFLHNAANKKLFDTIKDYDDIKVTLKTGEVKRCILSHYPIHFYNGYYHGAIMLHGHTHETAENNMVYVYAKWLNEHECPVHIVNVGCMLWNYAPVTLDEILGKENSNE